MISCQASVHVYTIWRRATSFVVRFGSKPARLTPNEKQSTKVSA